MRATDWLRCGLGILLSAGLLQAAQAASFEILFEEGAYAFDPKERTDDVRNKYLARVTIKRDGKVIAADLRGSTLPDAWIFYQRWNVELKKKIAPSDADIVAMFEYFEKQTVALRNSKVKLGETSLADIADILDVLNRVPAINSGQYLFVMGIHRNGQSKHGHPYVPRLLGGTKARPYDPDDVNSKPDVLGGFIRTLNKNNAQQQKKIADGINVHDGRVTLEYKDSEGCLTIRPQDWRAFFQALPSPEDWHKEKHTGAVHVRR